MNSFIRKMFHLSDLRYLWLLLLSMLLFILSLYNNKINPDINTSIEWLTYGSSIAFAFVWSILNYVDHIKINALYKKHDSIEAFVNNLAMKNQEKEDLMAYLKDFVNDLISNGKSKEEAVQIAISQFQVKEFTSISKNKELFELPKHYYLLGYVIIFVVLVILIQGITSIAFDNIFWLHAINFMLILYSVSFLGLLLVYRILDGMVAKKS